jgi:predicted nicotinamide N-methyase
MRTRGALLLHGASCARQLRALVARPTARAPSQRGAQSRPRASFGATATREQLSAALPFELKDVDVQVGNWGSVRLVMPASEDAVLDYYIAANRGDADPFFCSIWPSSIALAQNVLQQPSLVVGKRVIEVGCGLGLAGISAALAGARSVVVADREVFALRCSLLSARANGLFPTPLGADGADAPPSGAGGAGFGALSALELDWHAPPAELAGAFDVVLCADVLYEGSAAEPVAALALKLLAPGGLLLLADPPMRTPANRARFLDAVGPHMALVREDAQTVFDAVDQKPVPVHFHVLQKAAGSA